MPEINKKLVIYTVITNSYDTPLPPRHRIPGARYVLICDKRPRFRFGWEIKNIDTLFSTEAARNPNRWCKINSDLIFPEYDLSIYIDANIRIIGDMTDIILKFMKSEAAIGLFRHPSRTSIEEEIKACVQLNKITSDQKIQAIKQSIRYEMADDSETYGLTENGIILRNHQNPHLRPAMKIWWHEFTNGAPRDQISLPWVRKYTRVPTQLFESYRGMTEIFQGPIFHSRAKNIISEVWYISNAVKDDCRATSVFFKVVSAFKSIFLMVRKLRH